MLAVCQACQFFLPDIRGHHMLICSDSRSVVSYINHHGGLVSKRLHAGERPSCVGSEQSALTEGNACAREYEPRSRHVVKEQCLFRGMDVPPAGSSENLGNLWQGSSRPLCLQRQLSLPNLFYQEHGCPGPPMAQPSALCFHPSRSATAGTQASHGTTAHADSNSPPLEEPTMGVTPAAESSSMPDHLETGMARYGIHGPSYGPCMCGRSRLWQKLEPRLPDALKQAIFSIWC